MALGIGLEDAIGRIGHRRGVRNKEMVSALGGRSASCRFVPLRGNGAPRDSILRVRGPGGRHHLVYLAPDGRLHDPGISVAAPNVQTWLEWLSELGWRPVSYLPLRSLPSSISASESVSKGPETTVSDVPSSEAPAGVEDQEVRTHRDPETVETT
jgi:hypothetical protein